MATIEELEARLAALEGRLSAQPLAANPPITIGELADVPAPGSPIASAWTQEVTQRIHHRFATVAARLAAFPAPQRAQASYLQTGDALEGPEWFDGVAWRRPWNMPWGLVSGQLDQGQVTTVGGVESALGSVPAFLAPGGRRYKITADLTGAGSVLADLFRFTVRRTAAITGTACKIGPGVNINPANVLLPFVIVAYDTPPANANLQYMVGIARMAGTGVFVAQSGAAYGNAMFVEDIGPGGAPG